MRAIRIWSLFLCLFSCSASGLAPSAGEARSLTILHTNDLHARLLADKHGRGGFASMAAMIRGECQRAEACLVMDAGDMVQGTPVSTLFAGIPIYELANGLGLDVSTLGNHEFDYGWEKIPQFVDAAKFPIINANLSHPSGTRLVDAPYVILTADNGLRVAVIGLLTRSLPSLVSSAHRGDWTVRPLTETVEALLPKFKDDVDLVVALGHITSAEEKELMEVVGIDFVISGHNHSGLDEASVDEDSALLRVDGYGRQLGRLDLQFNENARLADWDWAPIELSKGAVEPDSKMQSQVDRWEKKVSKLVDHDLAIASRSFDRDEMVKLFESAMCDETGSDLCYMNRGGVRDRFAAGQLLERDVWNAMPFDDYVVTGSVKGSELPKFLREERGLDPSSSYRLTTIDFVADVWRTRRLADLELERGELLRDLLIRWVREKKRLD
jgi:2',3'-cyclic-nucleotide 2'-phosphodiesterase (5'-nucleotidase family)